MKVSKLRYTNLYRVFLITFVFIFLFLFQSCRKNDIANDIAFANEQPKDFFKTSTSVPDVVITIINQMKNDFKEKDIQNFINWHGQPLWNKIIKFNPNQDSSITYAIPIEKKGAITSFFGATINSFNKIKFEMHRKSAIISKKSEYSYANITMQTSNTILRNFSNLTNTTSEKPSAENENIGEWYCWYE